MTEPAKPIGTLDETDLEQNQRAAKFKKTASGYAIEQATRGSTIGLVLASNPLATLAWYILLTYSTFKR
jgi:microsomal epoxide hydrolase